MSEIAIKLENISKQYRLGTIGTGTLQADLQRWWWQLRGKGDPTLKIGSENKLNSIDGDYVWALQDINLEVKRGEVLGIIGKNGAGKSTLLKILSRVTGPTMGEIKVNGRIASLLEVGTGFHPELTGRENIFLNGAILGMTKAEIRRKLDEIVEFAGVAKYLETPVKRYSSGMYVRLAFAVAAHLDPEILIVDEVLAVGDAEFQKKAIGKMQDISKGDNGRTVLFVSHNMASVRSLCTRGVLMENGRITYKDYTNNVIDRYLEIDISNFKFEYYNDSDVFDFAILRKAFILNKNKALKVNDLISFEFTIELKKNINVNLSLVLKDNYENVIFNSISNTIVGKKGKYISLFEIYENLLNSGTYFIDIYIVDSDKLKPINIIEKVLIFEINDYRDVKWSGKWTGLIRPKLKFNIENRCIET